MFLKNLDKNKGQSRSLRDMLVGLLIIGIIGFFVYFFLIRATQTRFEVEENEIIRRQITLTNVLLSSQELIYDDGSRLHRGVLDKDKLDLAQSDICILSEITYPDNGYSVKVLNLETAEEWIIGEDFDPVYESPISIRYSKNHVDIGLLSVDFNIDKPDCTKAVSKFRTFTE
jgi:hypothetical protein